MQRKKMMLLPLLLICNLLLAQQRSLPDKLDTWLLDKSISNVHVYHMIKEYNGERIAVLKFNNKNKHAVAIHWKEQVSTQMEEGLQNPGGTKRLVLKPGITSYTDCSNPKHSRFITRSSELSPTYVAVLARFEIQGISVEKVKN